MECVHSGSHANLLARKSVDTRKELNSQRIGLIQQYGLRSGLRFVLWEHQYTV